ncbi:MAG TPA: HAD family hydrolase [Terriglobales bacterium]|nr:HAD family hydrolase [Terriglobales bacterium]
MPELSPSTDTFRWMNADVYLFDIDGTLLNTRDLVHWNALNRAMLEVYGVDTTIAGISYHGKTDLGILRAALERAGISNGVFDQKLPAALEIVRRHVSENATHLVTEVCCAIPEVLARLHAAGKLLGVASGNLESVGWKKVEAARLRHYFQFGCFSDRDEFRSDIFRRAVSEARSRAGEQATVCFIGDTPEDIRAARSAGAQIIAVCTGVYKAHELSGADACVASCSDLLA